VLKLNESRKKNLLIRLLSNRILFALHLFTYSAVMGLLILIWAVTGAGFFWPFFALFGWGFGMGFHALVYLMYNDLIDYLTKVRHDPVFRVLFIYHAWFYISVNTFLLIINLTLVPGVIFFIYPLIYWGIAFGFHMLGFFLWENSFNREITNLKRKYPDYEEKKLKLMSISKISNFWFVIIHISYYIIVNIWLYTNNILRPSDPSELIELTVGWGFLLAVHVAGYILFFFVEILKPVIKGLIIHISFYAVGNGWQLYEFFKQPSKIFWPIFSLILWGILVAYHAYITLNWDSIIDKALNTVKKQYGEDLDKYKLRSKARWFVFWMWSFIGHVTMWAVGIILIAIYFVIFGVQIILLIHPTMGWLIAVSIHGALFLIVLKNIRGFWSSTALIHVAIYISTGIYLVILNVLYSAFPWSAIALAGWGIGLGLHVLIAYLTRK
jgi:hypothetical protein